MTQRTESEDSPTGTPSHYTQINFLFKSGAIELPSGEKFKEFPEPAQKAILDAFQSEQDHRREWIKTQQHNDHELNLLRQRHAFRLRGAGMFAGFVLVLAALGSGVWLIHTGATPEGVGVILAGVATLVGTAIYGHRARKTPHHSPREPNEEKELATEEPKQKRPRLIR